MKANMSQNEKYSKNVKDLKTYLKNKKFHKGPFDNEVLPNYQAGSSEESDDSFDKAWNAKPTVKHTYSYA